LNLRKRETYNPSDDDAEIPTIPTIRTQGKVMPEFDFLFGDNNDTTASCLVQLSLEDLCRYFVEDLDVAEEQASVVTSMPETTVFDNNNNCVNYSTSQLKMIYQSDTPVIGASSTINLTKKRKRQMDDNVCNEVKKS